MSPQRQRLRVSGVGLRGGPPFARLGVGVARQPDLRESSLRFHVPYQEQDQEHEKTRPQGPGFEFCEEMTGSVQRAP